MKTLKFITEYLASPVVAYRKRARSVFFTQAMSSPGATQQLVKNLESENYDVVLNSLRILHAVAEHDPEKLRRSGQAIATLGKRTNHFAIAHLSKEIISILLASDASLEKSNRAIEVRLTPEFKQEQEEGYFSANCDHSLEYAFGSQDFKYELNHICDAFRHDCKKAAEAVFANMYSLGYRKDKIYRETRPARWRNDFYGHHYETELFYYSRHSIQIFLMWCVGNLPISQEVWKELVKYERKWDPSIPEAFLIESQPSFIGSLDLSMAVDEWMKKTLKKDDVYKLINMESEWVPLYESTHFKNEEKSFSRHVATCCIKLPINGFSTKTELGIPYYRIENSFINELPIGAKKQGALSLEKYPRDDKVDDKLIPNYGVGSEEYDGFVRLFPAPEIIEALGLNQKKNTLEYYKGKELVIRSINWRGGYQRNIGERGQDRYEQQNYGEVLLIKSKYLRKYLKANKLKLLALGDIWKRREKKYGGGYDFKIKDSKHKKAYLGIFG